MGGRVFYIGELGQASVIKVITNMLAFIHLVADGEALMLAKKGGVDLGLAWEVIKASSGNSFVHETEGQLILNGSYNINFTMDLARKDLHFAHMMGREFGVPLELASVDRAAVRAGAGDVRRRRAVADGRQDARGRRGHRPARARLPRRARARMTAGEHRAARRRAPHRAPAAARDDGDARRRPGRGPSPRPAAWCVEATHVQGTSNGTYVSLDVPLGRASRSRLPAVGLGRHSATEWESRGQCREKCSRGAAQAAGCSPGGLTW